VVPEGKSGKFLSYKKIPEFDIMRSAYFFIFLPINLQFCWLINFYFGFGLTLCDFVLIPLLVVLELKFDFFYEVLITSFEVLTFNLKMTPRKGSKVAVTEAVTIQTNQIQSLNHCLILVSDEPETFIDGLAFSSIGSGYKKFLKYMFTDKQYIKIKIKMNSSNGVMDSGFSVVWLWFRRLMIGWFEGMDERMLTKGVLRPFELFTASRCGVMASGFAPVIVQGRGRMLVGGESFIRDDRVFRTTTRVGDIGFASVMVQGRGRMLVGGFASVVQGHGRMLVGVESFEFRDDRVLKTTTRGDVGFASVMVQGHGRMLVGLRVMDSDVRTE